LAYGTPVSAASKQFDRLDSLLVPAAHALPSNAAYLAHLDAGAADPGMIRLASNESTEPPSPFVREALERAYEDANRSPSTSPPLRHALAERFGVTASGVLLGAGSTELIDATMRTFVAAGDEVVLPQPSWPVFGRRLAALEARVVEVPLTVGDRSYSYDVDALLDAVTDQTKLIVLCSPNNPTGNSMALEDLRRCAEAGPVLLADAAYADFDPQLDISPLVHEYSNVILARTFSKAYCLAGLRLGYVVGDPTLLDWVDRFLVPGSSVSSATLHAGLAALEDEAYRSDHVAQVIAERGRLLDGMRDLELRAYDSRGNFVAFDASAHPGGARALVAEMLAQRVAIRAMNESIVRVSVGRRAENDAVIDALSAVLDAAGNS
jgi:histidinol-phosphate aminotransferase